MTEALGLATERDHSLVAEIAERRKNNVDAQPTVEQLQAINRILVDEARDRLHQDASS